MVLNRRPSKSIISWFLTKQNNNVKGGLIMAAIIIDGEAVAKKIKEGLKAEIEAFKAKGSPLQRFQYSARKSASAKAGSSPETCVAR